MYIRRRYERAEYKECKSNDPKHKNDPLAWNFDVGYIQIIMLMLVAMSDTYVIKVYDLIGC